MKQRRGASLTRVTGSGAARSAAAWSGSRTLCGSLWGRRQHTCSLKRCSSWKQQTRGQPSKPAAQVSLLTWECLVLSVCIMYVCLEPTCTFI